jgi:hypothetical protein
MRRKIYKWHRTLSLIIALPVILWASSGFMHPLMTNIRPQIATQSFSVPPIDAAQINVPLQECLHQNKIDSFSNVHIVQMGGQQFYQVILDDHNLDIRYFSTRTGKVLKDGDRLYARFLAKSFLEGNGRKENDIEPMGMSVHDCCLMATMSIMNSAGSKITGVKRITEFDGEYKYINRLLPVYRVSSNRSDGIHIYVETAGSRYSYAVDHNRAAFDKFFGVCHTWEWMNALGNSKYFIMVGITATGFLTTLIGLYIFFTTKTKKSANGVVRARRNHRYVSLVASLFTLMFTFSGGFHALQNILPKDEYAASIPHRFAASAIDADFNKFDSVAQHKPIQSISLCAMDGKNFWQLYLQKDPNAASTDLMKTLSVKPPNVVYADADSYERIVGGDKRYAQYLASVFSNNAPDRIKSVEPVTKFTEEYGFINKRLPVWRVGYAADDNERYYIETSSGVLASRIRDKDLAEGYSFAFLHKHHFMDWGGKTVRDVSTMFWAAMQVTMVAVGLILYFRTRRRRRSKALDAV